MSNPLFESFKPVSSQQWKQKIQVDLKGANYNDSLIWQSLDHIQTKPFYHSDQFEQPFTCIPGHPSSWKIAQPIFIDDENITNTLIKDAISKGAEAIDLVCHTPFDIKKVFSEIPFKKTNIYINFHFLQEDFITKLIEYLSLQSVKIYCLIDPIGHLASKGNWYKSTESDYGILQRLITKYPKKTLLSIDTSLYENAGANKIQQLAYTLAHTNEYLNHFFQKEISDESKKYFTLTFKVSIGSNYFFEIAKIRALRLLYATLAKTYNINETCHIIATPSLRNKTIYDYNTNMLRTTTECMSAVLGGADTITNLSYDALYHKSNEFGSRISRNQLLILKKESYFDMVSNPSDGSYYIEHLTQEMGEKSLQLFKNIEANNGFLAQLRKGIIQKKIKESAKKEQDLFDSGALILVGTNKYQNTKDRMKDNLNLYPFLKIQTRQTSIEPILRRRLSEKIEQERLKDEQ